MDSRKTVSRRDVIKGTIKASAITGFLATGIRAMAATPAQPEGPFHPVNRDADLTRLTPSSPQAKGQVLYLSGEVVDEAGRPLSGAIVEVWQAAANGRYNHPTDPNPQPIDPNFQYWARLVTDAAGRYRFKTIKPGAYPNDPTWTRPSHIHLRVMRRGYHELTTQMYFEPENEDDRELLEKDHLLNQVPAAERGKLIVALSPAAAGAEPGSKQGFFRIELRPVRSR